MRNYLTAIRKINDFLGTIEAEQAKLQSWYIYHNGTGIV